MSLLTLTASWLPISSWMMARRSTYLKNTDPLPASIEKHIVELGFQTSGAYIDWCWQNGFEGSIEKSKADMQEELAHVQEIARRREEHARLHRNPQKFLTAACAGDITSDEIDRPLFKLACAEIEQSNESQDSRASLSEFLVSLVKPAGDLMFQTVAGYDDVPYMRGLVKMHDRKALWLRPIEDWKPKSKNRERMFGELARHLFDKYDAVPRFMDSVWLRTGGKSWRYRDWFVHIGRGHNLRKAKTPMPLTKKMAHHFLQAPDDYTVEQALRWGQLSALGASRAMIDAIIATRIGRTFEDEEFWFSVMRFFTANPMLDPRQVGPIVDYLYDQKYQTRDIQIGPGQFATQAPPQPGLSMSGRTVPTLLRQVDEWHRELGQLKRMGMGTYEPAAFEGYKATRRTPGGPIVWTIRQLRTPDQLHAEGEAMMHCVASYHWSCAEGYCTIWSLVASGQTIERRQTIEVDRNDTIVQCRGHLNRDPTSEEWSIVQAWADEVGLRVSSYLK